MPSLSSIFFFFNDTATTEIYTLSLHDALPISRVWWREAPRGGRVRQELGRDAGGGGDGLGLHLARGRALCQADRKSTRLNSSHGYISYAVFCLEKKKI